MSNANRADQTATGNAVGNGRTSLTLPVPPGPNDWPRQHYALHRAKNAYRRACWAAAVIQAQPRHTDDLSAVVRVDALFVRPNGRGTRDADNMTAALKWTLDALKAAQTGKVDWRQGAYDAKGYFRDDDPAHLTLGTVAQTVDRTATGAVLVLTLTSEG